jgi:biotin operon repressor
VITLQVFSRTKATDLETCRISHKDLSRLTGLSDITVRKAIRSLLDKGILVMIGEFRPKRLQRISFISLQICRRLSRHRGTHISFSGRRFRRLSRHSDLPQRGRASSG